MAQPAVHQQRHAAPVALGSLRALKHVKVLFYQRQPGALLCIHAFLQSLDTKSNITALDFSHDGTQLVLADENETYVLARTLQHSWKT